MLLMVVVVVVEMFLQGGEGGSAVWRVGVGRRRDVCDPCVDGWMDGLDCRLVWMGITPYGKELSKGWMFRVFVLPYAYSIYDLMSYRTWYCTCVGFRTFH